MKPSLLAVSIALGLCGTSARADLINIDWGSQGVFKKEVTLAPAKFAEVCGKLPAKTVVQWSFDTDARLDFNIHYHESKKVEFPARLDGSRQASGELNATVAQDFCWMWSNKGGTEAQLRFELKRE
jgi:hypothetical protein